MEEKDIRWKQRFKNFENAFFFLQEGLEKKDPNKFEEAGFVQSFEFTFELAWKTIKDFLESENVEVVFPRDVIKSAFQYELISDGAVWLDMLEKRNLMAHTYNETRMKEALHLIRANYFGALKSAYDFLKKKL